MSNWSFKDIMLQKLIEKHGFNPMNAFLTMDWLIREPTKVLRGLSRGRDYALVSSEVKVHYQQRKDLSKS